MVTTEKNDMIYVHVHKDHFGHCVEKRLERDKSGRGEISPKVM